MKNFTLELNKETADYLQRLAYEVMTRKDVVAHMLESAKDDTDASVLEEAECSYDIAKAELEKSLQPRVLEHEGKDVKFRWAVTDFSEHLVHITVLEG